jgi:hypothetical protein
VCTWCRAPHSHARATLHAPRTRSHEHAACALAACSVARARWCARARARACAQATLPLRPRMHARVCAWRELRHAAPTPCSPHAMQPPCSSRTARHAQRHDAAPLSPPAAWGIADAGRTLAGPIVVVSAAASPLSETATVQSSPATTAPLPWSTPHVFAAKSSHRIASVSPSSAPYYYYSVICDDGRTAPFALPPRARSTASRSTAREEQRWRLHRAQE